MKDVFIPLGSGSANDNLELRLTLRSIARYARNLGRVWVATDNLPSWVTNCEILPVSDVYLHNKDGNLFRKLLEYANHDETAENFLFWSDDQTLTADCDLDTLPATFNDRGVDHFEGLPSANRWHRRLIRTLRDAEDHGVKPNHHCETHIPQPHTKTGVKKALNHVDFGQGIGYTVNTFIFGRLGIVPTVNQTSIKRTFESEKTFAPFDRMFVGYNDKGFNSGVKKRLLELFPDKCKFER